MDRIYLRMYCNKCPEKTPTCSHLQINWWTFFAYIISLSVIRRRSIADIRCVQRACNMQCTMYIHCTVCCMYGQGLCHLCIECECGCECECENVYNALNLSTSCKYLCIFSLINVNKFAWIRICTPLCGHKWMNFRKIPQKIIPSIHRFPRNVSISP